MSAPEYTEIGSVDLPWFGPIGEDGQITAQGVSVTELSVCSKCGAAVADTEAHDQFHQALRRMQIGFPIGSGNFNYLKDTDE